MVLSWCRLANLWHGTFSLSSGQSERHFLGAGWRSSAAKKGAQQMVPNCGPVPAGWHCSIRLFIYWRKWAASKGFKSSVFKCQVNANIFTSVNKPYTGTTVVLSQTCTENKYAEIRYRNCVADPECFILDLTLLISFRIRTTIRPEARPSRERFIFKMIL